MTSLFNASAVATSIAFTTTNPVSTVTSSASATASSDQSETDAFEIAKSIAQNVANSNAIHDANVIDQTVSIINYPLYNYFNTSYVINYSTDPLYLASATINVSNTSLVNSSFINITGDLNRYVLSPTNNTDILGIGYYNFSFTEDSSTENGTLVIGNYDVTHNFEVDNLSYRVFKSGILSQLLTNSPPVGINTYNLSYIRNANIISDVINTVVITSDDTIYTFKDVGTYYVISPTFPPFQYTTYYMNFDNAKLISSFPINKNT